MVYLAAIIYFILSFAFTAWLITTTGSYWWVLLLLILVGGMKVGKDD